MKGIILAGGSGTRLYPLTKVVSKQLLPVYNKPLIYYPISTLMLAGVRQILLISTPSDVKLFQELLGDGSQWGIDLTYEVQEEPRGIAEAFLIGRSFLVKESCILILGDNIFFGNDLGPLLERIAKSNQRATVLGYQVHNPQDYGVIVLDKAGKAISIHEKPKEFLSRYAVTGLYFYDGQVSDIAASIRPSARGELEITDINKVYLEKGMLDFELLGRGIAWLDAGTPETLLRASIFVETLEMRQCLMIACLEEIAYRKGWINRAHLEKIASAIKNSAYGLYLLKILEES